MTETMNWPADKVERRKVSELIPYVRNSRTHSDKQVAQIAASIREWGWTMPILIDENDNVIAGHGRILAAQKLRIDDVPCMTATGWSEAKRRAYVIADNKLTLNAEWDNDLLKLELEELGDMDFDLELTGFDDIELGELLNKDSSIEGNTEDDAVPEVPETPVSKLGDIWILGNHRAMCGDSTDQGSVALLMNGEKADMVFTDPPYGISYDDQNWVNENKRQSKNAKQNNFGMIKKDDVPFDPALILDFFKNVKEIFIWGAANFCQKIPHSGAWIVWDKKLEQQDECLWGSFDLAWSKQSHKWLMCRIPWGGFQSKEKGDVRHHPTQKPIALAEWFFGKWGKPNDLVVDLFLGSGSTLIACEKTNRKCYGMELDPRYIDVIIKRWQDFTGKEAILESDQKTYAEVKNSRI